MDLCSQLRPFLDRELGPLARWRLRRHLRSCERCREQLQADLRVEEALTLEVGTDHAGEADAVRRVEEAWVAVAAAAAVPAQPRLRTPAPRLITATALGAAIVGAVLIQSLTAPSRAVADLREAMSRVQRFHVRLEIPGHSVRYEAWGERGRGARIEEWSGEALTQVLVDDGTTFRRWEPGSRIVYTSPSQLKELFRQANGLYASRLLTRAARGRLFQGHEDWLGTATARQVAQVRRHGLPQRRIHVDLRDGFFERMVVYAELPSDRLTQANLYTDSNSPDSEPFARVFFSYPAEIPARLFRPGFAPGTRFEPDPAAAHSLDP